MPQCPPTQHNNKTATAKTPVKSIIKKKKSGLSSSPVMANRTFYNDENVLYLYVSVGAGLDVWLM
jgi:hypothetical protein